MTRNLKRAMTRKTITISDELDGHMRREAARQGITVSELTRLALKEYLGVLAPGERRYLMSVGAGRSGRSDISEHIEEMLADEMD